MSKVPVEICLFLWRGLRACGRETSQGISRRTNCAAGPGYGTDEAAIPGGTGRVRGRGAGYPCRHANPGEGTRFSARDAGGWRQLSEYFPPHDGESVRILGPATAPLARLKKEHRFQFLLKSPKRSVLTKVLTGAMAYCDAKEIPQTAVLVDMDALSLL